MDGTDHLKINTLILISLKLQMSSRHFWRYYFSVLFVSVINYISQLKKLSSPNPCLKYNNPQGWGNNFYLRGARLIRKVLVCENSKFLLHKSPILRGARAPLAPLGPPALRIRVIYNRVLNEKNYFEIPAFLCLNEESQERENSN